MSPVAHCFSPNHNLAANAPSPSNSNRLARVRIPGVLRCSVPPRNPPRIEPLVAGVNVVLSCDGGKTVIADAVTNTTGFFEVVFDSASSISFGGSNSDKCRIRPRLPIAGCSVSVPTGLVDDPFGAVQKILDKLLGTDNNVVSNGNDGDVVYSTGQSSYNQVYNGNSYYNPSTSSNDNHVVYTGQSSYDQSTVHDESVVYNGKSYYYPSTVNDDHVVYSGQSFYDQSAVLHDEPVLYNGDSSYYNDRSSMQDNIHA
ncbi:hypothetical protein TorRG33x02_341360 [Trema orientale]|uniref:Pollen Ole e 1 allergen and extensin family protein n=1 Tax=Trema orientale TaxID=63057 RepID=A0A2P5AU16_TREOI|nr:hypothetical protein TorRG33x02_341360 [Trema orientale]